MALERIGVIGDIHAEHVRLRTALEMLEARGVDRIVATGDIADGTGSVDACCELLKLHEVVVVRGNHDRWLLAGSARDLPEATDPAGIRPESRAFLERLPRMVELATVSGTALLCHGIGPNDMAKVGPDDFGYALETNEDLQNLIRNRYFRWVINGHSHRRMVRRFSSLTIINAGTLKAEHSPCFLEVDFGRKMVQSFEMTAEGAIGSPSNVTLE